MSMALCIAAAGGLVIVSLPAAAFDLVWTHSTEAVTWRETYHVSNRGLRLHEASVRGSAAGMEPPPGSVLVTGGWRYTPEVPLLQRLLLAHSEFAGDYQLCFGGTCRPLASLVARGGGGVELFPCSR